MPNVHTSPLVSGKDAVPSRVTAFLERAREGNPKLGLRVAVVERGRV